MLDFALKMLDFTSQELPILKDAAGANSELKCNPASNGEGIPTTACPFF